MTDSQPSPYNSLNVPDDNNNNNNDNNNNGVAGDDKDDTVEQPIPLMSPGSFNKTPLLSFTDPSAPRTPLAHRNVISPLATTTPLTPTTVIPVHNSLSPRPFLMSPRLYEKELDASDFILASPRKNTTTGDNNSNNVNAFNNTANNNLSSPNAKASPSKATTINVDLLPTLSSTLSDQPTNFNRTSPRTPSAKPTSAGGTASNFSPLSPSKVNFINHDTNHHHPDNRIHAPSITVTLDLEAGRRDRNSATAVLASPKQKPDSGDDTTAATAEENGDNATSSSLFPVTVSDPNAPPPTGSAPIAGPATNPEDAMQRKEAKLDEFGFEIERKYADIEFMRHHQGLRFTYTGNYIGGSGPHGRGKLVFQPLIGSMALGVAMDREPMTIDAVFDHGYYLHSYLPHDYAKRQMTNMFQCMKLQTMIDADAFEWNNEIICKRHWLNFALCKDAAQYCANGEKRVGKFDRGTVIDGSIFYPKPKRSHETTPHDFNTAHIHAQSTTILTTNAATLNAASRNVRTDALSSPAKSPSKPSDDGQASFDPVLPIASETLIATDIDAHDSEDPLMPQSKPLPTLDPINSALPDSSSDPAAPPAVDYGEDFTRFHHSVGGPNPHLSEPQADSVIKTVSDRPYEFIIERRGKFEWKTVPNSSSDAPMCYLYSFYGETIYQHAITGEQRIDENELYCFDVNGEYFHNDMVMLDKYFSEAGSSFTKLIPSHFIMVHGDRAYDTLMAQSVRQRSMDTYAYGTLLSEYERELVSENEWVDINSQLNRWRCGEKDYQFRNDEQLYFDYFTSIFGVPFVYHNWWYYRYRGKAIAAKLNADFERRNRPMKLQATHRCLFASFALRLFGKNSDDHRCYQKVCQPYDCCTALELVAHPKYAETSRQPTPFHGYKKAPHLLPPPAQEKME